MRRRGWGGNPPETDAEARERILDAAAEVVREHGPDADIMLVAERLGVTRQTIYRYFGSRGEVFGTLALLAVDEFLESLRMHLAEWSDDPLERLVRAMLFSARRLPQDPRLGVVVKPEIAAGLLLSDGAFEAIGPALVMVGLGPSIPPDEFALFARLVHSLFVATLLAESTTSDDPLLAFYRYALAPFFAAHDGGHLSR